MIALDETYELAKDDWGRLGVQRHRETPERGIAIATLAGLALWAIAIWRWRR